MIVSTPDPSELVQNGETGGRVLPELLIAYATRAGSTAEVAEEMSDTIREHGIMVEVRPMSEVTSISEWKSVVMGAPLYMGRFPKEFHKFVIHHKQALLNTRPWIFALGPTDKRAKHFIAAEEQARKEIAKYSWLDPVDVRVLGGKFDPRSLPFPFSLLLRLPGNPMSKLPVSDVRDWEWIRTWARAIAERLNAPAGFPNPVAGVSHSGSV